MYGRRPRESQSGWKGSIAFVTAHRPGSLAHALACFAERGVNLTRLDSRPMLGRPFEYRFYVDFSINGEASSAAAAEAALNDLEEASAEQRRVRRALAEGWEHPSLDAGIGGSSRPGSLKCLHAHAAFALARPGYELGERILAEVEPLWPQRCCSDTD